MIRNFVSDFDSLLKEAAQYDNTEAPVLSADLDDIDYSAGSDDLNTLSSNDVNDKNEIYKKLRVEYIRKQVAEIESWITQFDAFINLINGTSGNPYSIQKALANADKDTVIGIVAGSASRTGGQSTSNKLTKITQDIASVIEGLKSNIAQFKS